MSCKNPATVYLSEYFPVVRLWGPCPVRTCTEALPCGKPDRRYHRTDPLHQQFRNYPGHPWSDERIQYYSRHSDHCCDHRFSSGYKAPRTMRTCRRACPKFHAPELILQGPDLDRVEKSPALIVSRSQNPKISFLPPQGPSGLSLPGAGG